MSHGFEDSQGYADADDISAFLLSHPEVLEDFVPPNGGGEDLSRIREAELANVRERLADKQREIERLQRELAEAKRSAAVSSNVARARVPEDRFTARIAFLEHQLAQSAQREQAALKDKQALAQMNQAFQQQQQQQSRENTEPPAKRKAVIPFKPTDGGLTTKSKPVPHQPLPQHQHQQQVPVPPPPQPLQQQDHRHQQPKPGEEALVAASSSSGADHHRLFIRKIYADEHIFRLLQLPSVDSSASHESELHEVAVQVSAIFADERAGPEALALSLARFLMHSSSESVLISTLAVLYTLVETVPEVRAAIAVSLRAMRASAHLSGLARVEINEQKPWDSLLSVLVRHTGAKPHTHTIASRVVSVIQLLAEEASDDELAALEPLLDTFFPPILKVSSVVPIALRVSSVKLLATLLRSDVIYRRARTTLPDGASLLRHVAVLMSMDHASGEVVAVLSLRQAAVRLFSVVVALYADWSNCTTIEEKQSGGASGGGGGGPKQRLADGDLGPRLITLLHEQVQQLRTWQTAGTTEEVARHVASVILETFSLLSECVKDPSVEAAAFGKMFRQLYVSSLVALSAPVPLFGSLSVLQPHAAAMLTVLATHCAN